MDVPGWIGHDDMELSKYAVVEFAQVTVNPLGRKLHTFK
jgi:hypothetical protein